MDECELLEGPAFPPPGRHCAALLVECLERRPVGAPATESYLETRGVQSPRRLGLPTGRRQVELRDERGGFIGPVDPLLDDWLVVEFDGREHHAREAAFAGGWARWDRIVAADYDLVVFTSDHVERRTRFVADTVAAALRGRGPARLGG